MTLVDRRPALFAITTRALNSLLPIPRQVDAAHRHASGTRKLD
ncbi:hypothetical protein [Mycobacteroides abscessus]|nr:hypothetical protein [Mycobacteroides abscessus]